VIAQITSALLALSSVSTAAASSRVFVYQKQKHQIAIKTCTSGKLLKQRDCSGPSFENLVDAELFKQTQLSSLLIIDPDKLKPLSEDEMKSYRDSGLNPSDIMQKRKSNLNAKLEAIEKVLVKSKNPAKSLQLLKRAKKQLLTSNPSGTDVLILNELLKKIFDEKLNDSARQKIVETETPQSQTFWRQFDASIPECGADDKESIEQRIAGCSTSVKAPRSSGAITWQLVSRQKNDHNGKYYEVWKDTQSGLLWGDLHEGVLPYYFLVNVDDAGKVLKEKFCSSPAYKMSRTGITQVNFRLPTIAELEQAVQNGIAEVAPNMNQWYWSASPFPNEYQDMAWGLSNGIVQYRDFDFKYYYSAVRCVGRL